MFLFAISVNSTSDRFYTIVIKKSQWDFFCKKLTNLKFAWKFQGSRKVKTTLKRLNGFQKVTICDFKSYCSSMVMNTMQYWLQDRLEKESRKFRNKSTHIWLTDF